MNLFSRFVVLVVKLKNACCCRNMAGQKGRMFVDALEGGKDILGIVAVQAVQVEESGVELGHEFGPVGFVPLVQPSAVFGLKAAASEAAGLRERQHIDGGASEFQHPLGDPVFQRFARIPWAWFGISVGRKDRKLFY